MHGANVERHYPTDVTQRCAGGSLGSGSVFCIGFGFAPGRGLSAGICFGAGARHHRSIHVDRGVGRGKNDTTGILQRQ